MTSADRISHPTPRRRLRVLMTLWNGGGNVPPQRAAELVEACAAGF